MMLNCLHLTAFLVAFSTLSACSVQSYKEPVTTFSTAVADANKVIADLNVELTKLYSEQLERDITDGKLHVFTTANSCQISSTAKCQLVLKATPTGKGKKYPPDPVLENFAQLIGGVNRYAQNLAEIVDADTVSQVKSSVDKNPRQHQEPRKFN